MPHESLLIEEDLIPEETGKDTEEMMDPFYLAHRQIHTVVNKHAPNQHYPTYEEDAARNLEIERARRSLVREALRSPFVIRKIANIQKQVYAQLQQKSGEKGEDAGLSFNRHIRVSETEGITEKARIRGSSLRRQLKREWERSFQNFCTSSPATRLIAKSSCEMTSRQPNAHCSKQ